MHPHAGNIHYVHYRAWRNTGVGFEFGDEVYTAPNRSFASFVLVRTRCEGAACMPSEGACGGGGQGKERGVSVLRRGFWGDTISSPYHAVGTSAWLAPGDVEGGELFAVMSKGTGSEQWRHVRVARAAARCERSVILDPPSPRSVQTAVDMSVYNLLAWLHEIETGLPYKMSVKNDVYRCVPPWCHSSNAYANGRRVFSGIVVEATAPGASAGGEGAAAAPASATAGGGDAAPAATAATVAVAVGGKVPAEPPSAPAVDAAAAHRAVLADERKQECVRRRSGAGVGVEASRLGDAAPSRDCARVLRSKLGRSWSPGPA